MKNPVILLHSIVVALPSPTLLEDAIGLIWRIFLRKKSGIPTTVPLEKETIYCPEYLVIFNESICLS